MSQEQMIDKILDAYPDQIFLKADGFDSCIVGIDQDRMVIAYSCRMCIQSLVDKGYDYVDAIEFFESSVRNVDFGSKTPIFIEDNFD